jgi:hypothetical protein
MKNMYEHQNHNQVIYASSPGGNMKTLIYKKFGRAPAGQALRSARHLASIRHAIFYLHQQEKFLTTSPTFLSR